MIVSQGKETDELLNVFKGKFIISNFAFQVHCQRGRREKWREVGGVEGGGRGGRRWEGWKEVERVEGGGKGGGRWREMLVRDGTGW